METESIVLLGHRNSRKSTHCNKMLLTLIVFLIATNITTILLAIYTEIFNDCSMTSLQFTSPDINIPDGNQFNFNTNVCKGFRTLWEDPSIEISQRNTIGRAIFQTPAKLQEAISLIKIGKRYDLGREYSSDMPFFPGRFLNTQLYCNAYDRYGGCTQGVTTNALGNIGTQFDYFTHYYLVDTDKTNETNYPSNEYLILWNNFKGSDVFNNFSGNGDSGGKYLSADNLPMFFTKAILIDIAGYKEMDILDEGYVITTDDFLGALHLQNIDLSEIGEGDVVLIYTGWSEHYHSDPDLYMDFFAMPGIGKEVITEIIFDTNAAIIGSDNWSVDAWIWNPETNATEIQGGHDIFITCGGGFIHENMKLDAWVMDARDGNTPWIGAYVYQPVPIEGAVASAGKPVVFV